MGSVGHSCEKRTLSGYSKSSKVKDPSLWVALSNIRTDFSLSVALVGKESTKPMIHDAGIVEKILKQLFLDICATIDGKNLVCIPLSFFDDTDVQSQGFSGTKSHPVDKPPKTSTTPDDQFHAILKLLWEDFVRERWSSQPEIIYPSIVDTTVYSNPAETSGLCSSPKHTIESKRVVSHHGTQNRSPVAWEWDDDESLNERERERIQGIDHSDVHEFKSVSGYVTPSYITIKTKNPLDADILEKKLSEMPRKHHYQHSPQYNTGNTSVNKTSSSPSSSSSYVSPTSSGIVDESMSTFRTGMASPPSLSDSVVHPVKKASPKSTSFSPTSKNRRDAIVTSSDLMGKQRSTKSATKVQESADQPKVSSKILAHKMVSTDSGDKNKIDSPSSSTSLDSDCFVSPPVVVPTEKGRRKNEASGIFGRLKFKGKRGTIGTKGDRKAKIKTVDDSSSSSSSLFHTQSQFLSTHHSGFDHELHISHEPELERRFNVKKDTSLSGMFIQDFGYGDV
ncbi:hypothetical protein ADUPG1_007899 [Aduncisulcus paluster]|uniref:Uncharacterized protein n=1 Tax=Aduncisulcus paluster TaxID=2918883 RepID=A0ABQ5KRF3_9EUKA|nr:hypothetical protein ADUPG1_007899 [Aduncisulcus paluster]